MKKATKATLKSLAKKGRLYGRIESSFDGMIDGFSNFQKQDEFHQMSIGELNDVWVSNNYIYTDDNNMPCGLANCCYRYELKVV